MWLFRGQTPSPPWAPRLPVRAAPSDPGCLEEGPGPVPGSGHRTQGRTEQTPSRGSVKCDELRPQGCRSLSFKEPSDPSQPYLQGACLPCHPESTCHPLQLFLLQALPLPVPPAEEERCSVATCLLKRNFPHPVLGVGGHRSSCPWGSPFWMPYKRLEPRGEGPRRQVSLSCCSRPRPWDSCPNTGITTETPGGHGSLPIWLPWPLHQNKSLGQEHSWGHSQLTGPLGYLPEPWL